MNRRAAFLVLALSVGALSGPAAGQAQGPEEPLQPSLTVGNVTLAVGDQPLWIPPPPPYPYVDKTLKLTSARVPGVTLTYRLIRPVGSDQPGSGPIPIVFGINVFDGLFGIVQGAPKPLSFVSDVVKSLGWILVVVNESTWPDEIPNFHAFLGWKAQTLFLEVLDDVKRQLPAASSSPVYVGGCSKGAVASVGLAYLYPDLFAGTFGDSGTYDEGTRGTAGIPGQFLPVPPFEQAANPIPVIGGEPHEVPWAWDAFSAYQLSGDPLPHSDLHGAAYPEYAGVGFPGERMLAWNASALPSAIIGGFADPLAPYAVTSVPFVAWIGARGYPTRHQAYPYSHCPWEAPGSAGGIYSTLRWLQENTRTSLPLEVAYQSVDVVDPEATDLSAWPYFRLIGADEGNSMPLQSSRHDRGYGLKIDDPLRYRVRIALTSGHESTWAGTVALDKGRIVRASGEDDGVGLLGRLRDVPGSTATTPPKRQWLEEGDTLEGTSFRTKTDAAASDPWDMVTLEIEAPADDVLSVRFPDGERRYPLSTLRIATTDGLSRTLDEPVGSGRVRLQVLQSHEWWWSQIRAKRDPPGNRLDVWVRNVAGETLDLPRLGIDPGRRMTVSLRGAEYTGPNVLTLLGSFAGFNGTILRDGTVPDPEATTVLPDRLVLRDRGIAGETHVYEIIPQ